MPAAVGSAFVVVSDIMNTCVMASSAFEFWNAVVATCVIAALLKVCVVAGGVVLALSAPARPTATISRRLL
ncbi:MAG TPA: hypothetical protein VGF99_17930 [Myxococcota bacterium]